MVSEQRNACSRSAAFVHQTAEPPMLGAVKPVFDAPVVAALKFAFPEESAWSGRSPRA